jgi:hypothetical protein
VVAWLMVVTSGCGARAARTVPLLLQAPSTLLHRPLFRWTPADLAVRYQIQIDDSPDFTTPDVDQEVTGTSFVPAADLAVSTSVPVGRRYFWRVRGCNEAGSCAPWSRIGIVDVGRQRQDFNGDGYADLAVVTWPYNGAGSVFVYFGGPALPTSPGWVLRGDGTSFAFRQVLWAGDVNGDGFSDLAVVVTHKGAPDTVRVYLGGGSPSAAAAQEVAALTDQDAYVATLLSGDMNGDGFADLFQSYWLGTHYNDFLSFGPDLGTQGVPFLTVQSACDFDADGATDLLQLGWCVWNLNGLGSASLVSATGVTSSPVVPEAQACDGPLPSLPDGVFYGFSTGLADVGDVDGDGYGDLLVGDPVNGGAKLLFGGCPVTRVVELPGDNRFMGSLGTGRVAAAGDLDGDGFPDFAVANFPSNIDGPLGGDVYIYRGGPSSDFQTTPSLILTGPDAVQDYGFGVSLD